MLLHMQIKGRNGSRFILLCDEDDCNDSCIVLFCSLVLLYVRLINISFSCSNHSLLVPKLFTISPMRLSVDAIEIPRMNQNSNIKLVLSTSTQ
jgi:hypothetical protein